MATLRSQSEGFSFIELMIVIAIVSTFAAIANPALIEARKGSNEAAAISAIHSVDALSLGVALPLMKSIAASMPGLGQQIATAMDTNHDGMLSFDESLNADIAGPTLRPLLAPLTDALRRDLALGVANEQLPVVQISSLGGDILAFLNKVPPFVP